MNEPFSHITRNDSSPGRNATRCATDARRVASLLLMCALFAVGCNTMPQSIITTGQVQHVVVCWLKPGADREAVIRSANDIAKIPGVLDVSVGRKLVGREGIVDNTYDLALTVTFTDEAALRAYDQHPIHQRIVETVVKPNVAKYVIYDALLENYTISDEITQSTLDRRAKAIKEQAELVNRRRG